MPARFLNLPGIAGFAKALEISAGERQKETKRIAQLRQEFVALLHTGQAMIQVDSAKFANYKHCLWNLVLAGNLHAAQYAVIIDAIYDQGIYGMQVEENILGKITRYAPIQHPEKVDSLRASIYLSPLWVQSTLTGYKPPKGYKKAKK